MTVTRKPGSKPIVFYFAVVVLLTCCARISAATLADYARRVSVAVAIIEQLQAYDDKDPSLREHFVVTNIKRIREQLPAKELVLVNGQSVAVDNGWLHAALGDYEKTTGNQTKRAEMLVRIGERLRALDERLKEMQGGQPANATDKDESKGRLAEILRRPEYNKSVAEGSALQRLLDRILRWLLRLVPRSKPPQPGGSSSFIPQIAQVIVVLVCVTVVAFLIWKFGPRFLQDRRKKKKKREARIVLGERLEPDQTSADLLAQAEALAGSGDLRGAIRKAYIALLCELGDRKIVSLAQHKTNRDYLNSVRERVSLHSSMRRLTNSFELHWYGFQPAAENDWNEFRNGYHKILKTP
jgi:hypothetical protein